MNLSTLFRFLNYYLGKIVPVITKCNGFVDKYIGDGIMAVFVIVLFAFTSCSCFPINQKMLYLRQWQYLRHLKNIIQNEANFRLLQWA